MTITHILRFTLSLLLIVAGVIQLIVDPNWRAWALLVIGLVLLFLLFVEYRVTRKS